ncbi:MAG: histidine kinase N-terminal 7TM domain-containing protein [Candidatus Methanoperedens sp.]
MLSTLISVMLSLISVFLYVGLGAYALTKNPRERTNFIFVLLMLVFIIWSMGTYNIGIMTENAPLEEILLFMKLELSGVIISITLFVVFALFVQKKENPLKNPLTYISLLFSIYLLNLILTIDTSTLENNIFILNPQNKLDFFLYSAVFGIAGVYVLLRHYMTSKYRQKEQANIIILGSVLAILVAVVSNIILPLFFNIYLLPLSSLAPALMGIFFAYAV